MSLALAAMPNTERLAWRELISNASKLEALDVSNPEPILAFSELIDYLLSSIRSLGVPAFLERLINRSGLLQYIIKHDDKIWLLQIVKTFFDFVREEANRNPRLSIKRLLNILQSMDANRLAIEINKTVTAENGVNLLTAHSAKGLEFEYVFLIDCVKEHWEPRGKGGMYRFPFPDTLTFSGEEDALEARRRLFYVAMTRAKTSLHISFSYKNDKGKALARTQFIDEIVAATPIEAIEKQLAPELLSEIQLMQLQENVEAKIPNIDPAVIAELLEGFSLSVSAMNRYLKCPLAFYYENVLRVPVLVSEAANYGTAMHNALQRLFEKMLLTKDKSFASAAELVRLFEYEMAKRKGLFSPKEYERRMEMGRQNLTEYYLQHASSWHKKIKVEINLRNVEIDGVPINGTIDRLELHEQQTAKIIDYKTGRPRAEQLRRFTDKNPLGGPYWRQLIFYKLLFEHANLHQIRVSTGTISYLEADKYGAFLDKSVQYDVESLEVVKGQIKDTYSKIMNHEFYEGCGEPNCKWCNFVKDNHLTDSFSDPEIEQLDDK